MSAAAVHITYILILTYISSLTLILTNKTTLIAFRIKRQVVFLPFSLLYFRHLAHLPACKFSALLIIDILADCTKTKRYYRVGGGFCTARSSQAACRTSNRIWLPPELTALRDLRSTEVLGKNAIWYIHMICSNMTNGSFQGKIQGRRSPRHLA